MPQGSSAGVVVLGLLVAACVAAPPVARNAGQPDHPGSYAQRPWVPPSDQAGLGPAAQPGTLRAEPAMPHSLGIQWPIMGDDNGNAVVQVAYREASDGAWRDGLPLFWVHPERTPDYLKVPQGRLFAGSLLDLAPNTDYELKLTLIDPDGGSTVESLILRTRDEPLAPEGLRPRHVVPGEGGGSGSLADPFKGLATALEAAGPGDLILLHGGIYAAGGTVVRQSGAAERPIILRAAGDGPAILDGGGQAILLDLSGRSHIWLEGLTLRNADKLVEAARAHDLVFRGNRFELTLKRKAAGINARKTKGLETTGFFITDNVFVGESPWPRKTRGKGPAEQTFGIGLTGSGHVIAYNRMIHLGDGINNGSGGHISASDVHNNDIVGATDDCLEADHSTTNLRVYRNRLTNCHYGVSAQPVRGGPAYIFRNQILNTKATPFKLHNHTSGVLLFHNTSVRAGRPFIMKPGPDPVDDVVARNNIFLGSGKPALRSGHVMRRNDFDNDGYGWGGGRFAVWNRKRYETMSDTLGGNGPYGRYGAVWLSPWSELESGLSPPTSHEPFQEPSDNDPRLSAGSRAVDRGVVLPNINDGFSGVAPDLGCCELGQPQPHFGPRGADQAY
ncbi:MAG: right-handed parallel beta-helix repeat-containing protein [Pseudomonadota bacterium]